jgi:hypothetical protein
MRDSRKNRFPIQANQKVQATESSLTDAVRYSGDKENCMKSVIVFALIALCVAPVASAYNYASSADNCIKLGYDKGTPVTSGRFRGMFVCECNVASKSIALEANLALPASKAKVMKYSLTIVPSQPPVPATKPSVVVVPKGGTTTTTIAPSSAH